MGLYSAALMSGGGLAAVLGPHINAHFGHWQAGLGLWAVPAVLALLAWPCCGHAMAQRSWQGHPVGTGSARAGPGCWPCTSA